MDIITQTETQVPEAEKPVQTSLHQQFLCLTAAGPILTIHLAVKATKPHRNWNNMSNSHIRDTILWQLYSQCIHSKFIRWKTINILKSLITCNTATVQQAIANFVSQCSYSRYSKVRNWNFRQYLEADKASASNSRQLHNEQDVYNAATGIIIETRLIVLISDVVSRTRNEVRMHVSRITLQDQKPGGTWLRLKHVSVQCTNTDINSLSWYNTIQCWLQYTALDCVCWQIVNSTICNSIIH